MSATPDRRSASKHQAILDAATGLFLSEGYSRTSMNGVAAASGVSKQTLYAHFDTKRRLFLAAVEQVRDAGSETDDGQGIIPDTGDPRADLGVAARRILRVVLDPDHAALHRVTIAELTHHPELQRDWRDGFGSRAAREQIAAYLAARHRDGTLVVPDPELAARQFGMLLAAQAQVRSLRGVERLDEQETRQIVDQTVDLILRAHHVCPPRHR